MMMFAYLTALLLLLALASAQAHGSPGNMPYLSYTSPPAANLPPSGRPAPAPPAGAPAAPAPLEPVQSSVPPVPTAPTSVPPAPAPAPSAPKANPIISMIQSALKDPAFSATPTPKYESAPVTFALSDISFANTLVPKPKPPTPAVDATPGEVRFCTGTTYTSESGDAPGTICDAVHSTQNECRNLSDVFKNKVVSVKPDKGQLCLFFEKDDCYGDAEWIRWPGVQNLRGRIGHGNDWAKRIVSFQCTGDDTFS